MSSFIDFMGGGLALLGMGFALGFSIKAGGFLFLSLMEWIISAEDEALDEMREHNTLLSRQNEILKERSRRALFIRRSPFQKKEDDLLERAEGYDFVMSDSAVRAAEQKLKKA